MTKALVRCDHYRAMTDLLDSLGIPYTLETGRKHAKLRFYVNGRVGMHPVSFTPSDHRAAKNAVMQVKRSLRAMGVQI